MLSALFPVIRSLVPVVKADSASADEIRAKGWSEQYTKSVGGHPDDFSPKERLRQTWVSLMNRDNWEYDLIAMTGTSAFIFGGLIGAMARNEENKLTTIRQNSHLQFDHPYLAKRHMTDQQYVRNIKNGFKFGWRTGLFATLMCTGALSTFSYRNYISPLDFAAIFGAIGGVWKWQKGPKGMLAAGAVSGTFGLLAGSLFWLSFRLSGNTVAEFRITCGAVMLERQVQVSKKKMNYFKDREPGLQVLLDREMALQQRLYEERMKEQESLLVAKQKELVSVTKSEKENRNK